MDKSLEEEGDEWKERKRKARHFVLEKSSEIWSLTFKWSKFQKCKHMTSIYSLSVTQNWKEKISLEFEIEFVEPNFGAKISLIMISKF